MARFGERKKIPSMKQFWLMPLHPIPPSLFKDGFQWLIISLPINVTSPDFSWSDYIVSALLLYVPSSSYDHIISNKMPLCEYLLFFSYFCACPCVSQFTAVLIYSRIHIMPFKNYFPPTSMNMQFFLISPASLGQKYCKWLISTWCLFFQWVNFQVAILFSNSKGRSKK